MDDKMATCPGCGRTKSQGEWDVDVRELGMRDTIYGKAQVSSCGFRCQDCGTVWGHEEK